MPRAEMHFWFRCYRTPAFASGAGQRQGHRLRRDSDAPASRSRSIISGLFLIPVEIDVRKVTDLVLWIAQASFVAALAECSEGIANSCEVGRAPVGLHNLSRRACVDKETPGPDIITAAGPGLTKGGQRHRHKRESQCDTGGACVLGHPVHPSENCDQQKAADHQGAPGQACPSGEVDLEANPAEVIERD